MTMADAAALAPQESPMPRHRRVRRAARLALVFFSASLVVFVSSGFLRGGYDPNDIWQVGLPMMVVDGLIAFLLVFPLNWTERMPPLPRWTLIAIAVLAAATLQSLWDTQLRVWDGSVLRDYGSAYAAVVRSSTLNIYHVGLFVALLAYQAANQKLRDQQGQLEQVRASEQQAHMLALRFQLNPHFLFNTLNAISSLVVVGRPHEAEEMIDRLAAFLRASLTADPLGLVTLDDEFEMLGSYLDIESVRFGERLAVEIDLPSGLGDALVPPFLLQPLVENAVKYAVAPVRRTVQLLISAREEEGLLVLRVVDDGDGCGPQQLGSAAPGTGIGHNNIRERLRLRYGDGGKLSTRIDQFGCRAEVRLPLEREAGA
jgi:Histidine kinase